MPGLCRIRLRQERGRFMPALWWNRSDEIDGILACVKRVRRAEGNGRATHRHSHCDKNRNRDRPESTASL